MGAMKNIILDMEVDFNIWEEAVDKFWQSWFVSWYRIDWDGFKYLMEDKDWEWKVRPYELRGSKKIGFTQPSTSSSKKLKLKIRSRK
jgi:hypothetical protein